MGKAEEQLGLDIVGLCDQTIRMTVGGDWFSADRLFLFVSIFFTIEHFKVF